MANILICDDEQDIVNALKIYLNDPDYVLFEAHNGKEAVDVVRDNEIHLVLMDIMMPELDGFSAVREIRKNSDVPVIMLSARGEEYDKLFGFEVGVDDYVTKPFSPKELMARANVIMRRHHSSAPQKSQRLKAAGIELDTLGHEVYIDGQRTELTAKEYGLLLCFMQNKSIVLSRDKLLNQVWGYDYFGDDRTVDWQIKLLRNKLGKYREYIHTIRGVGYKFET